MKRRELITLLGGAAVWPLQARAQPSMGVQRVEVLLKPMVGRYAGVAACGSGGIVEAARAAQVPAMGSDVINRGFPGTIVRDFFDWREPVGNIVSNPPFGIAERFVPMR